MANKLWRVALRLLAKKRPGSATKVTVALVLGIPWWLAGCTSDNTVVPESVEGAAGAGGSAGGANQPESLQCGPPFVAAVMGGEGASVRDAVFDRWGGLYVGGSFSDGLNIGGARISGPTDGAFVVKFDATGVVEWVVPIDSSVPIGIDAIAAHPSGGVVATGSMRTVEPAVVDFGPAGQRTSDEDDVIVLRIHSSGEIAWAELLGGPGAQWADSVLVTSEGRIFVAGVAVRGMSFGLKPYDGSRGSFLLELDGQGVPTDDLYFGEGSIANSFGIAELSDGRVAVAGGYTDTFAFDGVSVTSQGNYDGFVATFARDGLVDALASYGSTERDAVVAVNSLGAGDLVVAGTFVGEVDFGGGNVLTSDAGSVDSFVAWLGPDLNARSTAQAGLLVTSATLDQAENVIVGGYAGASTDFAGRQLAPEWGNEPLIAWLDPNGSQLGLRVWAGGGHEHVASVAAGPCGDVAAVGYFDDYLDIEGVTLTATDPWPAAFVVKVDGVQ